VTAIHDFPFDIFVVCYSILALSSPEQTRPQRKTYGDKNMLAVWRGFAGSGARLSVL
jgi:hypothetical protein